MVWGLGACTLVLHCIPWDPHSPSNCYAVPAAACRGRGFVSIQRYGEKYTKPGKDWKRRRPVRLLFTGGNHYDLLLK